MPKMVPRLSLPATTRQPSTVWIRNDSHLPLIFDTSIFFSLTRESMNLLLPIVPTTTEPRSIVPAVVTTSDALPVTFPTSSPRSFAARMTPAQSLASTRILAETPSFASWNAPGALSNIT